MIDLATVAATFAAPGSLVPASSRALRGLGMFFSNQIQESERALNCKLNTKQKDAARLRILESLFPDVAPILSTKQLTGGQVQAVYQVAYGKGTEEAFQDLKLRAITEVLGQ